jgi:cell division protein FtsX
MDRRYYFTKFAVIVVAVVLALAGSGMSAARMTHTARSQAQYSASAQLQDAAWHATNSAARSLACLASRTLHNLAEVAP